MPALNCTTIRDAYNYFCDLYGKESPVRTLDELRDVIHSTNLLYEQLTDENFWSHLSTEWMCGEDVPALKF